MTREEQIMEYANSFEGKGVESDELKEIIRLAIIDGAKWADAHPKEPSLPSNLDEAAEEYGRKEYSHAIHFWDEGLSKNKPEVMKEDFVAAFKAGAEWMAGQGYTKEGIARPDDCEIWVNFTDTDIKDGDEVVVQIRKKQ